MRMLIRRASATSNIIDSSISEVGEDEQAHGEPLHMLQSMLKTETSQFKEQLATVSQWFQQWSDCEQTIGLCTLLKQLDSRQARFIEQLLQDLSSTDPNLEDLELQANSLEFVSSLDSGQFTQEELIQQLLKHFPLLHSGNTSVKNEYLKVIPKAFSNSVANGTKVEDCRKLLTYTLVHPAVSTDERARFTKWLEELEHLYSMKITQTQQTHSNIQSLSSYAEHITQNSSSPSSPHTRTPTSVSKDPSITVTDCVFTDVEVSSHHLPLHATSSAPPYGSNTAHQFNNNHRKLSRTRSYANQPLSGKAGSTEFSLGPSSAGHWRAPTADSSKWMLPVQDNASPAHSNHGPLSPQSSLSSTDSEHEGSRAGVFYQENSGMKEFQAWLKSLRLHKYSPLFESVSYEEMLQVDSKWLEDRQVTKGARNKLAQSIAKLRDRASELRAMEANVIQGANLKQVLLDLKVIVHTPIKPYMAADIGSHTASPSELADNDLPGLINKLTGRLCTQLLVNSRVEDECYPLYIQLIDKCLHHEAFTVKQRKLLQEWRSQVVQRNSGRMITGRQELRPSTHRPTSRTNSWNQMRQGLGNRGGAVYAQRAIQGQNQWHNGSYEKKALGPTYSGPEELSIPLHARVNKAQVTKSAIHRTQSAPIRAHQPIVRTTRGSMAATEPEINERLDSLARSMTEAALSSQDSVEQDDGDKQNASE
ncbi:protein Smaug homolog 1-like [Watersipora subatra]|uniref:protein Smaug homolog 1-like n=1 Tax=Watersipora subatra TaxID=2589382 RepID=UPI00355C547C